MLTKIVSFSLENKFLAFLFLSLLIILGIQSFFNLKMDAFPDVTNIQVEIVAISPTLSPIEMDKFVTYPLENSLRGIPGLSNIRSTTKFGISVITAIFKDDVDIYFARQQVFERISGIMGKLPEGVDVEIGPITTAMGEIYQYTLQWEKQPSNNEVENLTRLRTIQDYLVAPLLKTVEGVSDINSFGGYIEQINVLTDPLKLYKFNLTLNDIYDALKNNNLNVGGGIISKHSEQMIVQGIGMFSSIQDIERIVVKSVDGIPVYLKDVADVNFSHAFRKGGAIKDGREEVVGGIVMMLRGENSREVVKRVEKKVDEINSRNILPNGLKIKPYYKRSEIIEKSINGMVKAILEGAILVIFVIFLSIRQLRGALIVVLSLPLTAFFTFLLMRIFNISANLMSLGGIAISIGMIVDASIIQVENVQRHINENGSDRFSTVLKSVLEVRKPSIFGEIIISSVFLPIFSLQGMEGKMFSPLAITVIIALLCSLTISILFVPSLCYIFLKSSKKRETFLVALAKRIYLPVLQFALQRKLFVITFFILILAISLFILPKLGREFIPVMDEGAFDMDFQLLPGVSLEKAMEIAKLVGSKLMEFPELETVVSRTGQTGIAIEARGVDRTGFVGTLKPKSEWKTAKSREELFNKIRDSISEIPGIVFSFSQPIQCRISELMEGTRAPLVVKIFGDDIEILKEKAREIESVLSEIEGSEDIMIESIFYQPYLTVSVDREKVARYGLNAKNVLETFELAMGEKVVTRIYEGSRFVNIAIRFPDYLRNSVNSIGEVMLKSPNGYLIPMKEVVKISLIEGPSQISRENGKRRVGIEWSVTGRDIGSFVEEAKGLLQEKINLPPGYYIEWGGQYEQQKRTMKRLMVITPIVILFIFIMLSLSFNSFKRALLVASILPFSLAGGILAIYVSHFYISVPASLGFIATFGIAVLNGIVLVSYIQQLERQGIPLRDAILKGCEIRLRPVLMTAFTTAFGLIPMLIATGPGSEIQKPLAVVVVGGLLTSTVLTLIVLPTLYDLFFSRGVKNNKKRKVRIKLGDQG